MTRPMRPIRRPSTKSRRSATGWARSTTPSPAASATRTPPPADRARSRNCAWATSVPRDSFAMRTSRLRGQVVISGRTLVNDRAICPNAEFPDSEIQERVPDTETVRTTRLALNLLGDGLVEAVADETLIGLAREQRRATRGRIHGQALRVPIVEAPGETRIGRFGWKDQHASLLSFAGDAYLNEMGITSRLFPTEVTDLCNTAGEPNSTPDSTGLEDIDRFARFMRASKAPARDRELAATPNAMRGSALFDSIGCASCHVPTLTTAPAGTAINGGTFTIPPALGDKVFHPFGDFLLHDVGTGDGIAIAMSEHYGRRVYDILWKEFAVD